TGHIASPGWVHKPCTIVYVPVLLMALHEYVTVWFWFRARKEARLRDGYRREILELLRMPKGYYPDGGFRFVDLAWMTWQGIVTLLMAIAVVIVVQNAVIVLK